MLESGKCNLISCEGVSEQAFFSANKFNAISQKLFRFVVALSATSLFSIWTTGYLRPFTYFLFFIFSIFLVRGRAIKVRNWLLQALSLIAFFYMLRGYSTPRPGIIVLLEFNLSILFLQILNLNDRRGVIGGLVLCLMALLAVAAMNVNFLFPIALFPFLIVSLFTLNEMTVTQIDRTVTGVSVYSTVALKSFQSFRAIRSLLIGTLFLGLWIFMFYLIPRTESFGLASELGRRKLKGFSEELSLGEGGFLEDNPTVIMRVKPLQNKSLSTSVIKRMKDKKLRGTSFAVYSNGKWQRYTQRKWLIELAKTSGEIVLIKGPVSQKALHRVEISLENTDPPVVFFPDQTVAANFDVPYLVMHQDQSYFFTRKETSRKRYQANLILNPLEIKDVPITSIDLRGWQRTYVNTFGVPEKIQKLSDSLASGVQTIHQAVEKGMGYLNKNCRYSLYEEFSKSTDPVEDFLFKSRAGSCEHFASALTLLLRGMKVAARPVSGYTMGDWNELGSFFTIRQRHAHTWVEVYFPGQGWIPYDPTPGGGDDGNFFDSALFRPLTILWEAYEGYWFRFVYSFDNKTQGSGFRIIQSRLSEYMSRLWSFKLLWKDYLFFALLLCSIVFPNLKSKSRRKPLFAYLPDWYLNWIQLLPIERLPWMTPREFNEQLLKEGIFTEDSAEKLEQLAQLVYRDSFGKITSENEAEIFQIKSDLLNEMKTKEKNERI